MALSFPFGYNGKRLTWDQMMTQSTVNRLHPEVRRRLKALIEHAASQGRPLGVGTGWRVQPNPPPPGFAKPGNSWHESCPVSPASPTALAIDTVLASSWPWMEEHCGAFGFRTFKDVNDEPWHIQPVEIPGSRKFATTLPPLKTWPLPGLPKPPSKPKEASVFDGIWQLTSAPALFAIYTGGYKVWIKDSATLKGYRSLAAINGHDPTTHNTTDVALFRALGPIVGPIPSGYDEYGLKK